MNSNSDNKPSGPDAALVDEELEHLPKVEHILKSLTKLIHGRKLYAENNPRLAEFSREFEASLESFFRVEDALVLNIDQYAIDWRGGRVYENPKREDNIAFLLHRDGVGEITIESKAVGQEIDRLVKILTDEYYQVSSDEDVVTKFWHADFNYISYRVLDVYLASEYGDGCCAEGGEHAVVETADQPELLPSLDDKGRIIINRSDPLESIDTYLKKLILRTCQSTDEAEREAYFQSMVGSFFTVSTDELNHYHQELETAKQHDNLSSFLETIIVFVLLKDNPPAVRDVRSVVEKIVTYAIEELDPLTLRNILTVIRKFRTSHKLSVELQEFFDKLGAMISQDTVVETLGEKLKTWDENSEAILGYFTEVGSAVVDSLLKALHNVEGDKLHTEICDVLIKVAGKDISGVIERLDVDKPKVAFDAVYIANKTGMTEMSPKIQELLFYPDVSVKEEMIKLVSRSEDAEAVNLLIGAMDDEDKKIRLLAMDIVSQKKDDGRVLERVTELALGKGLVDRSADERETIFRALGRVGNAGTVAELRKFVDKKNFMQFGKQKENKLLAIRALEFIHSSASVGFLKKLTADSNTVVQTLAQRAHDSLVKSMRAERDKPKQEDY